MIANQQVLEQFSNFFQECMTVRSDLEISENRRAYLLLEKGEIQKYLNNICDQSSPFQIKFLFWQIIPSQENLHKILLVIFISHLELICLLLLVFWIIRYSLNFSCLRISFI